MKFSALFSFLKNGALITGLLSVFIFSSTFAQELKLQTSDEFTATLIDALSNPKENLTNKRGVIRHFCNSMISAGRFAVGPQFYDPSQSVRLASLCQPLRVSGFKNQLQGTNNFLKTQKREEMVTSSVCNITDDPGLENCRIPRLSEKLFSQIMNEYSNVMLAQLYGLASPKESPQDQANRFSVYYFDLELCKQGSCPYPKTHNLLKEYMKNMNGSLIDARVLDPVKMEAYAKTQKADCSLGAQATVKSSQTVYDLHVCGLYQLTGNILERMQMLTSNELMMLQLFTQYYIQVLSDTPGIVDFQINGTNAGQGEKERLIQDLGKAKQATLLMQRMLGNVHRTFPIHIGLLMYYEDIVNLRQSFVKLYTPIHQLYYKLRNVQETS